MKNILLIFIAAHMLVAHFAYADMSGWTKQNKAAMTQGCVSGILVPARRDFRARAIEKGKPDTVFPESKIRPSIKTLCSCIVRRAATSFKYQRILSQPQLTQTFISEAFKGGECKPTGFLDKAMKPKRG